MSQASSNLEGFKLSLSNIEQGYGRFPYVIVRMHHGIYAQFPIHFVKEKQAQLEGIVVQVNSDDREEQYRYLIRTVTNFKKRMEEKNKRSLRLCVVLDASQAYYFEEHTIVFSNGIPRGGTLLNSQQKFIAMNQPHHL